jgi:putative transposase
VKQIARNVTMEGWGVLRDCRYVLHDRDTKFNPVVPRHHWVRSGGTACAAGAVRSVKEECLSKVLLIGKRSLR